MADLVQTLVAIRPGASWNIQGPPVYANLTWLDSVQKKPTEAEIAAYVPAAAQQTVLSQDLMAQFTAADAALIQTAIASNAQFWLLWSALQAQRDPMLVTSARFKAGWAALVQVLGAPRMATIATALGVTIT
jgi:hypothetical protein